MQKKILSVVMMLSAIVMCSSCLSNSDVDYDYSDDSAISAFSLGNVQYVAGQHKATGKDSIVSKDFKSVKFRIDQLGGKIYNVDSLPMQALAAKVLCTLSTYNSGVVGLKSATSDTVKYFASTDTIDFTTPRTFIVYSNSGLGFRRYTVSVNVHKQDSAAFVWKQMPSLPEELKQMKGLRMTATKDGLHIAATDGAESFYYVGSKDNMAAAHKTATWTSAQEGANVWNTLVGNNAKGFVAGNGGVAEFDDNSLQTTASAHHFNTLLAATSQRLYANVDGQGLMSAPVDNLTTGAWTAEPVSEDDNMAQFPTKGLASATLPLPTNSDSRYVVVVGHNDGEAYSSVWAKIEEDGQNKQQWMQYPYDDNDNRLPAFDNLQMGVYNGRIVALGHNNGQQTAKMYRSEDHGLTWQADTVVTMPEGISSNGTLAFAIDSDNFVWIVCGGTGQVWRGRQNFLGWEKREDVFEEKKKAN